MDAIRRLDRFHRTTLGLVVFGAVELGVAYVLVVLAIDSGYLWEYGLAIILAVGSMINFVKLVGKGLSHAKTS